uniref:Translation machinery-associated protein 16 n=1 Tax=Pelodiscus sinensis TaxID=13735 RepID=K7FCW8_PELSI
DAERVGPGGRCLPQRPRHGLLCRVSGWRRGRGAGLPGSGQVQPKVPKGRGGGHEKKVIHPYSRKAAQLAREAHKQEKKEKCRLKNEKALRLSIVGVGEKLQWFQSHLDPSKADYTKKEACELIEKYRYLHRFSDELEQIELHNSIKGRQGRQHGSREMIIKQTTEHERQLYEGYGIGIDIPDIVNSKHLKIFRCREWDGDLKKLPNIKMRKVSAKDAVCNRTEVVNVETEEELDAAKDTNPPPDTRDETVKGVGAATRSKTHYNGAADSHCKGNVQVQYISTHKTQLSLEIRMGLNKKELIVPIIIQCKIFS